jgi:hypothetical protein
MSDKKRLSRHDDRPGSVLSLWHLWNLVGATEELDSEDEAFTDEMWSYCAHQIARESERPGGVPDLRSPLGPVDADDVDPAA